MYEIEISFKMFQPTSSTLNSSPSFYHELKSLPSCNCYFSALATTSTWQFNHHNTCLVIRIACNQRMCVRACVCVCECAQTQKQKRSREAERGMSGWVTLLAEVGRFMRISAPMRACKRWKWCVCVSGREAVGERVCICMRVRMQKCGVCVCVCLCTR